MQIVGFAKLMPAVYVRALSYLTECSFGNAGERP